MAHILIAEDERNINEMVKRNLNREGHTVEQAYDGATALRMATSTAFDLLLLDIMMPELRTTVVKQHLKSRQPIIFLAAKNAQAERLKKIELDADDYIIKPFEMSGLLAQVEAVLQRKEGNAAAGTATVGKCRVTYSTRTAVVDERKIQLTPQEFNLLRVLIDNKNIALSRGKLLEFAWGYQYGGDTRTVDVHIQKLRKKLSLENEIQTVYKLGYRLCVQ